MKFNFENLKRVAIGAGAGLLITSAPSAEKQNQENLKNDNLNNIETENFKNPSNKNFKTISFEDAKKNYIQGGDYYEGNHFKININPPEDNEIKISDEDKILLNQINNLERKFSSFSKENFEILNGSISIISDHDLGENTYKNEQIINEKGIEVTSPLENQYIIDVLNFNVVNNMNNVKVLDKSSFSLEAIKTTKEMHDENYIKIKGNGYKHYMPEYYFVLTQESNNPTNIEFKIKIISSKKKNVVKKISLNEELPTSDRYNDPILIKLVKDKIVPDIENEIKKFLDNHKN